MKIQIVIKTVIKNLVALILGTMENFESAFIPISKAVAVMRHGF